MGALMVVGLLLGPIGVTYAQEALPTEIQAMLAEAAGESDEALLEAVATAVEANPELAQAIVDEAVSLNPDIAEEIVTAATEAGGEDVIVPAAGPLTPLVGVLAGAAAAGGGAAAVVSGVGGDGGDGGAPPPPVDFETPEFNAQEGLGLVNASDAYLRGLTGEGVIVAVLDSGLDVTHPEFAGQIAPGGFDFVDDCEFSDPGCAGATDPNGHGTHVAGIIAANKDDVGMHGVAFNSRILPLRFLNQFGTGPLSDVAPAFDLAVANGAAVINNSWGSDTDITTITREQIEIALPDLIAAVQRTVNAGDLFPRIRVMRQESSP